MKYETSIVWLRRDLRLSDNRALFEACNTSKNVFPVFVFDTNILKKLHKSDRRVSYLFDVILDLSKQLEAQNSSLIILYGDPEIELPKLAFNIKAQAVFSNRDYEPYAKKRDLKVEKKLAHYKIDFLLFKDHVIFESNEVTKTDQTPYAVFSAYKKTWLKKISTSDLKDFSPNLRNLAPSADSKKHQRKVSLETFGFKKEAYFLSAGQKATLKRYNNFQKEIANYHKLRDFPAKKATSNLSIDFRFGTLSIRDAVRYCYKNKSLGSKAWLSELIWRDFFQMILDQFPKVEYESFKLKYEKIKWPGTQKHFEAWKQGETGFPIIDASMRYFNKTGLMHNRLRMVVASFLVKDLLIDWKLGQDYFAQNLFDFDLAANNGGWQWCASTGCDAQPYFRIFNPLSQSLKFDPDGAFIRQHCPELRLYSNRDIHSPAQCSLSTQQKANCIIGKDYPKPIVDHSEQRDKVLKLFNRSHLE